METDKVQSFSEDVSELLGYLKKIGDMNGYKSVFDAVAYVNTLESTIKEMAKQIADMREEVQTVHEQNAYLMSRAERTTKDILMDQLKKAENHVADLGKRLSEMKAALKESAREMLDKVKTQKDKAILRFADIIHIKNALSRLRERADDTLNRLDNLSERVEAYKSQSETERRKKAETDREEVVEGTVIPIGAVAEEMPEYRDKSSDMPTQTTYERAMEQFMANRVSEGVTYSCNQEAYEDFKAHYDKQMKADSMAGVHRDTQIKTSEKSR